MDHKHADKDDDKDTSKGSIMDVQAPKNPPPADTDSDSENSENSENSEVIIQEAANSTEFKPESLPDIQQNDGPEAAHAPIDVAPYEPPKEIAEMDKATEVATEGDTPPVTEETESAQSSDAPADEPTGEPVPASDEGAADLAAAPAEQTDKQSPLAASPLAIANNQPAAPAVKSKSGLPIGVVVIAIIVCLVLGGLSVVAYMKTNKDTTTKSSNTPTTATPVTTKATTADVDTVTKEVDSVLSASDETTDFPANEMSDASLGL